MHGRLRAPPRADCHFLVVAAASHKVSGGNAPRELIYGDLPILPPSQTIARYQLELAVEDKIGKLGKYFAEDTKAHVTLSVEKERQKVEVTIPVKGSIIRSEQVSNDMYVSIDLVEEVIERQMKRYRTKIIDRYQDALDECYGFVNEYPDSKYKTLADRYIEKCKKVTEGAEENR